MIKALAKGMEMLCIRGIPFAFELPCCKYQRQTALTQTKCFALVKHVRHQENKQRTMSFETMCGKREHPFIISRCSAQDHH